MEPKIVEKRRAILINVMYFALIVGVFYLVMKLFSGILMPFIAAFIAASILQRPVHFLARKTRVGKGPLSAVFVLLILGAVGLLVFLVGSKLFVRVKGFYDYVMLRLQNPKFFEDVREWLIGAIGFLPGAVRESLTQNINVFFEKLLEESAEGFKISSLGINWSSLLSNGMGTIKNTVVQIPSVLIGVVVSVVATVFMTIEYNEIKAFIARQFSPQNREKLRTARTVAVTTLKKMLKAYSLIVLITSTELCIGFYILKFLKIFDSDYIVFISVIIAIIDIIPVLGTGTVLIPWAVYSFVTGKVSLGIGLIVIYAVILVVRQVIEPKLVAGQVGLSPIITIIAMYVGAKLLGVLGFFILPFTVIVIKRFNDEGIIHLFKTGDAPAPETPPEGDPPEDATPAPQVSDLPQAAPECE